MPHTEQVFHMEHIFDAPIEVVFNYFTVPELVKTWWGPKSVTTETVEIDLQVNGICRWEMRDNEQHNLLILHGQILELMPPKHLVMTHQWDGNDTQTTLFLDFMALGQQTKLRLKQTGIASDIPIHLYNNWWASAFERSNESITQPKSVKKGTVQ